MTQYNLFTVIKTPLFLSQWPAFCVDPLLSFGNIIYFQAHLLILFFFLNVEESHETSSVLRCNC